MSRAPPPREARGGLRRSGWRRAAPPRPPAQPRSVPLLQGSAPILVAMVILLNIGVAILFINFFI